MKILITGVAGGIGTNLAHILLIQNRDIVGIDNFITGKKENITLLEKFKKFHFFKGDVRDSNVWKFLREENFQCKEIYHLACPTGVPNCAKIPIEILTVSLYGTLHVLQFAHKKKAKVIFTSSSEVYGDPQEFPQKETYWGNVDPIGLRSPYEEGKRIAEALIMTWINKNQASVVIARLFNTYGPYMSRDDMRAIPQFIKNSLLGKPLIIYGDGTHTRTFCFVDDTVRALILLMNKGKNREVYNVGNTKEIGVKNLAKMIINLSKSKSPIVFKKHFIPDHQRRLPDTTKLTKLGWNETVSLKKGLRTTMRSLQ